MSFPWLTYVPSSTFLASSTACSSPCLVGFFHPTATPKIDFPRIFPGNQPSCLIDNPFPHDVPGLLLRTGFPIRAKSNHSPSGLWSGYRSVVNSGVFTSTATRSPLKFSLPRVFLRTPWNRLHGPSAHDLPRRFLE
jgi:hypothetical protein